MMGLEIKEKILKRTWKKFPKLSRKMMRKLLMMFSILFNTGCLSTVEIDEPIVWEFKIIEHNGKKLVCEDPEKLYERLKSCERGKIQ